VRIVRIFTPVVIGIIITSALLVDFATAAGSPNINSPSFTIMYVDAHATTGAGGGLDWTRFSALDSSFPRGASSYGGSGGSSTHSHTTSSNNYQISTITGSTRKSGGTSDAGDHYHIHHGWWEYGYSQAVPGGGPPTTADEEPSPAAEGGDEGTET